MPLPLPGVRLDEFISATIVFEKAEQILETITPDDVNPLNEGDSFQPRRVACPACGGVFGVFVCFSFVFVFSHTCTPCPLDSPHSASGDGTAACSRNEDGVMYPDGTRPHSAIPCANIIDREVAQRKLQTHVEQQKSKSKNPADATEGMTKRDCVVKTEL